MDEPVPLQLPDEGQEVVRRINERFAELDAGLKTCQAEIASLLATLASLFPE